MPARKLEQLPAPVPAAAEVRDDDDERALAGERVRPRDGLSERRRPELLLVRLVAKRSQKPDEPDAALPRRQHARVRVSEGHDAEPVSAPRRQVADREGDAFRDVRLAAVGGPELHRDRCVDHEPADEDPLRERDAHVRLHRPRGDVPVDAAHVVARHVRADERELGAFPVERRAVVAGEQSFDAPPDADVEGAQERLGHRPGAGASWAGDG